MLRLDVTVLLESLQFVHHQDKQIIMKSVNKAVVKFMCNEVSGHLETLACVADEASTNEMSILLDHGTVFFNAVQRCTRIINNRRSTAMEVSTFSHDGEAIAVAQCTATATSAEGPSGLKEAASAAEHAEQKMEEEAPTGNTHQAEANANADAKRHVEAIEPSTRAEKASYHGGKGDDTKATSNGVTSTVHPVEGDDALKMLEDVVMSTKAAPTVQSVEADDTMKNPDDEAIISKASADGMADGVADRVRYNVASSAVVTSSGKSDGGELLLFVSRLQLLCNSANFLHYVSVYYFRCRHCP